MFTLILCVCGDDFAVGVQKFLITMVNLDVRCAVDVCSINICGSSCSCLLLYVAVVIAYRVLREFVQKSHLT